MATLGGGLASATVKADTAHLSMTATISDAAAAPGKRLSIVVNVNPGRGMHLYAAGNHDYQMVRLVIDPQPWLRLHELAYPASEIYHFKPLDERVEGYMKPFQLRHTFTMLATSAAQKQLASMATVTLAGALEYQACDDKVCFNPSRVPICFTLQMQLLVRRPPGN